MPIRTIAEGECLSDIAEESGLFWETIWNQPENGTLRTRRSNPNVLKAGDQVYVPEKRQKEESCDTTQKHYFRVKGVPVKLVFYLFTMDGLPRPNLPYEIDIDSKIEKGTTDEDGRVEHNIPPKARKAVLTVPASGDEDEEVYEFQLARLNPVTEPAGIKARLMNLGYYEGTLEGAIDEETRTAIRRFQLHQGLDETGEADEATRAALLERHGS